MGVRTTHSWDLSGRGTTRAEDAQGTPTQSHISPSILVYKDDVGCTLLRGAAGTGRRPNRVKTPSGIGVITRAEEAQGTPTQSHISPSILVYEDDVGCTLTRGAAGTGSRPTRAGRMISVHGIGAIGLVD